MTDTTIRADYPEPDEHPYRCYLTLGDIHAEVDEWAGRIRFAGADGTWSDDAWQSIDGPEQAERLVRARLPRQSRTPVATECWCPRCGETFIESDPEPIHFVREDGIECGGKGEIVGSWS